ncbi:hypothetical protein [Actinokineospora spheciospongiae]|uniref:hypothetical protein n=1 Tax=Actinokineospora spheciospongiae TaxID=909613 RepID=UPI000D7090F5|nr:hypothetical protein [Actinokineospora spheciospongiae]PWW59501.1 hypothetical protein DFQ13_108138 [Actinokineospora spheciospongiae]
MSTQPEEPGTEPVTPKGPEPAPEPVPESAQEMSTARTQKMTSPGPLPPLPGGPGRPGPPAARNPGAAPNATPNATRVQAPLPGGAPGPDRRSPLTGAEREAVMFRVPEARPSSGPPRPAGPPAPAPERPKSGPREWYRRFGPGSLSGELAAVRPGQLDDVTTRAVGNWVSHEEATARLAEARAEPHLHEHLVRAGVVGRRQGWRVCAVLLWPLAAVLIAIAVWILGA